MHNLLLFLGKMTVTSTMAEAILLNMRKNHLQDMGILEWTMAIPPSRHIQPTCIGVTHHWQVPIEAYSRGSLLGSLLQRQARKGRPVWSREQTRRHSVMKGHSAWTSQ